ncbi:MAG: hypothetical protein RI884_1444 [Pseudomonadota bacterium]|jgi:hypothetical protein
MLRIAVLVLLIANAAWFAWAQDLLRPWGLGPSSQAEPQRVDQQVLPASIRLVQGAEAARLVETAALLRPPECLATAPLTDAVATVLRQRLAGWPPGSWRLEPAVEPARWIIYMGKYPDAEMVERKKAELRRRGVSFEPVANPSLQPGLSLGGFTTQAAANDQLAVLATRDVRSARVVLERPELRGPALRLPLVDDLLRPRLAELQAALAGRPLAPCR